MTTKDNLPKVKIDGKEYYVDWAAQKVHPVSSPSKSKSFDDLTEKQLEQLV